MRVERPIREWCDDYPLLAYQWSNKNNNSPHEISKGSDKKIWWKCDEKHEWQATILTRIKGHGCPFCSGRFATKENNITSTHIDLIKEWHPKNTIKPENIKQFSNKKV